MASREETRYRPCRVLDDNQIPYVVWFEDALHHYGVPTVVFDLYILVPSIEIAADCLVKAGWALQSGHTIGMAEVQIPQQRLVLPGETEMQTVLLSVSDWKFSLDDSRRRVSLSKGVDVVIPPLPSLLDALIETWLDGPSDDPTLLLHLACQVNYLYDYVPVLKERSFADQMRYEHRQLHYDVLAGMDASTLPFRNHERGVREALLQGRYELQECSASREDKLLSGDWGSVRLPEPEAQE
ncbi:hypothetical protein BDV25DRAFT_153471 [Aspergillus avenaceus]|uniref:Uncharacterized protein n=1 Tax=Aspergillus avenaceus TaxID=36643 RepID=A0A5N6TX55_ASPAV|nr:hypothetical protein BDV25DRAFT_153471 [Aspergillus avenaceus]